MKKVILTFIIVALTTFSFTSCKNEVKNETTVESTEEKTIEDTSEEVAKVEYQCPMKCEDDKTYTDENVKCPVCGMDLKEIDHNEDH